MYLLKRKDVFSFVIIQEHKFRKIGGVVPQSVFDQKSPVQIGFNLVGQTDE
jgi:hypothetical protein